MRRSLVAKRKRFVEEFSNLKLLADDALKMKGWKRTRTFELLAVGACTEWDDLVYRVVIVTLATDPSGLAAKTKLAMPRRLTEDVADAILTARSFLDLQQAESWLVKKNYPLAGVTKSESDAASNLRIIRNYIAHRSRQSLERYKSLLKSYGHGGRDILPGVLLSGSTPAHLIPASAATTAAPSLFHSYLAVMSRAAQRLIV